MQGNIPEGDEPVYNPYRPVHRGDAEGGPNDGKLMFSESLTEFIPRKIERKGPDPNTINMRKLSPQERDLLQEIEKAQLREAIWARQNPHRYDFDIDRQKWIYVEYQLSPLDEV